MNQRKKDLLAAMEQARFSPISETAFTTYQEFESMISPDDTEDYCRLYFYRGEFNFRTGRFQAAISDLMQCIRENKNPGLLWITAHCYNILGLIHAFLGSEFLAMKNYQQCLSLSKKHRLYQEITTSYINIGRLYRDLDDDGKALEYYLLAEASVRKKESTAHNLEVLCLTYQGHIYCRQDKFEQAAELHRRIEELISQNKDIPCSPSLCSFYIRLFFHQGNKEKFTENLNALIAMAASQEDFVESSKFYYDICGFLIDIRYQKEARKLLDCMEQSAAVTSLLMVQYHIAQLEVNYCKYFAPTEKYVSACENFIELEEKFFSYNKRMKIMHIHNIEELEQIKIDTKLLREKSQIDQLTGLLNKHTIEDKVKEYLEHLDLDQPAALLLIDMDNFKQLNDSLGHLTGDKVLKDVSTLITSCFSQNAFCGRIGGDEFLVCFKHAASQDTVRNKVSLFQSLIKNLSYGAVKNYRVHASIGAAFFGKEYSNYTSLFVCADGALYNSKQQGKNQLSFGNCL